MIVCYRLVRVVRLDDNGDMYNTVAGKTKDLWFLGDYYPCQFTEYYQNVLNWWLVPGTFRLDDADETEIR